MHIFLSFQAYIETLVKQAYTNWYSLEVMEGVTNETPLLTQGIYIHFN